ncbi:MAG: hypothetical protein IT329_08515 [Caldilineaceae bacterium]|nr:hypothetical protein [Caldilineaceae bacterium]
MTRSDLMVTAALAVVVLLLAAFYGWRWWNSPQAVALATPVATQAASPPTPVATLPTGLGAVPLLTPPPSGGDLREAVAADAIGLNPLFAGDPAGSRVADLLYPRLVGQDPSGGFPVPTELAQRWEVSPDGRVYTFTLRSGVAWSDGTPVSAADVKFTYDALADARVQSPFRDRAAAIAAIDTPDAHTVVVTLRSPSCSALFSLRQPLLPSHRYAPDFSDLQTNPLNAAPSVSAGPFRFAEHRPGERIVLARDDQYWKGAPRLDRWVLQVIPDAAARRQAVESGTVDLVTLDPPEIVQYGLPASPQIAVYDYPADGYTVLAFNLADPANPQPGRDAAGAAIDQPPHPILGDGAVRQAIAEALDIPRLLDEVWQGQGYPLNSYVLPTVGWAAADLSNVLHDPARAGRRLEEAGWSDPDGDGIRAAGDRPLRLTLQTNEDNPLRVQLAERIAAQLRAAGFQIDLAVGPFEEVSAALLDQRFDLAVIGWENVGADPALSPFWHSREDRPGAGFNVTSFHDAEVDGRLDAADQMPGCGLDERGALYRQVQEQLAQSHPYIFLAGHKAAWVYANRWQGIAPGPWGLTYNVEAWALK